MKLLTCRRDGECLCNHNFHQMNSCNMSELIETEPPDEPVTVHGPRITMRSTDGGATWTTDTVLDEARGLTDRTRKDVYAHPAVNFERIARLWSVILGVEVSPEQHALCMIAVKLSRLAETPGHRDSLIDIAGYARTIEMLGEGVNP